MTEELPKGFSEVDVPIDVNILRDPEQVRELLLSMLDMMPEDVVVPDTVRTLVTQVLPPLITAIVKDAEEKDAVIKRMADQVDDLHERIKGLIDAMS